MIPKTFAVVVCLALMAGTTSARGADASGRFAVKGAGLASCQDYTKAWSEKSPLVYSLLGWLDGYLTAYNQLSPATFDVASWESSDLFARILDGHCRKHPDERFVTVVRSIVSEIADNRLRSRSPLVPARIDQQGLMIYQETLRRAQEKLSKLGHDPGGIDGHFGARTKAALVAFQEEQNLAASGLPDQATLWKLFRPSPEQ